MLDVSRRSFLRGAVAVAATSLVVTPTLLMPIPQIVGDGVFDDAPGLNALLSGQPVDILTDAARIIRGDQITISGGVFRISRPLRIVRNGTEIFHSRFVADYDNGPMIDMTDGSIKECVISNNFFAGQTLGQNDWLRA